MDTESIGSPLEEMEESSYRVIPFLGTTFPVTYRNMVYSKWMRSLRYGNDYFKLIDSKAYYATYDRYIGLLLERPKTVVRVALLSDDLDVALGFSVSEGHALHYVHVQKDMRNKGIGTSLVPFEVKTITHLTKNGLAIWSSKLPMASFNPFI